MRNYTVSCTLLLALVLAMCQAESRSARLTAFGKTPTQNHAPSKKNTLGRTRECNENADCNSIQNTTCLSDHRDGRKRCLCRDYSAPVNGACPNLPRAVRSNCNHDYECVERAECRLQPNSTYSHKMCLCKEGFTEDDGQCNHVARLPLPSSLTIFSTTVFLLWFAKKQL